MQTATVLSLKMPLPERELWIKEHMEDYEIALHHQNQSVILGMQFQWSCFLTDNGYPPMEPAALLLIINKELYDPAN